jgi:hypothetical protein
MLPFLACIGRLATEVSAIGALRGRVLGQREFKCPNYQGLAATNIDLER